MEINIYQRIVIPKNELTNDLLQAYIDLAVATDIVVIFYYAPFTVHDVTRYAPVDRKGCFFGIAPPYKKVPSDNPENKEGVKLVGPRLNIQSPNLRNYFGW